VAVSSTSLPSPLPPASPLGDHRPGVGRMELGHIWVRWTRGRGWVSKTLLAQLFRPPPPLGAPRGRHCPTAHKQWGNFSSTATPKNPLNFLQHSHRKLKFEKLKVTRDGAALLSQQADDQIKRAMKILELSSKK